MLLSVIRLGRGLVRALFEQTSPHQFALGVALGMMVGLAPKGNLIAVALSVFLFALRTNLGAGVCSALLFSWIGAYLDPFTHQLGHWLLTLEKLQATYAWLYQIPTVPWTAFNNTVVLGNLILSLILFYPVYRAARFLSARYGPAIAARARQYRIGQLLLGADVAASWRPS